MVKKERGPKAKNPHPNNVLVQGDARQEVASAFAPSGDSSLHRVTGINMLPIGALFIPLIHLFPFLFGISALSPLSNVDAKK